MKASKETPKIIFDEEVIARINSDGQFFKGLWTIFNVVLLIGLGLLVFWLFR